MQTHQTSASKAQLKKVLTSVGLMKVIHRVRRLRIATGYYNHRYAAIWRWIWNSNEYANFTYRLKKSNLQYLAQCLAFATHKPLSEIESYISEVSNNSELNDYVVRKTKASDFREVADERSDFGRRLGWYALARALKPKLIVETGVDKGLGALILNYALLKNFEEGFEGRYLGTDINPNAGYLLDDKYKRFGKILYGDSIESLKTIDEKIDLFVNDSDHSADYEYREYQVVKDKMSDHGVMLGDNAHVTDKLSNFAKETGRYFLFFKEDPEDHWYPGAGIGICFRR